jgi:hypothetical protein
VKLREHLDVGLREITDVAVQKSWGFQAGDKPGEDHGIASALHAEQLLSTISSRLSTEFAPAVTAMALHNHAAAKIKFTQNPLSVLLVLADELQEWERSWMEREEAALVLSSLAIYGRPGPARWYHPLTAVSGNIAASWHTAGKTLVLKCASKVLDFTFEYQEDIHRNNGIFGIWLGRAAALQRISLENARFDCRYRLISKVEPPEDIRSRSGFESQMERLKRLVRAGRLWPVRNWIPLKRGVPTPTAKAQKDAVAYDLITDDNSGIEKEILVLNVAALGQRRPLPADLSKFWDAVTRDTAGALERRTAA